MNKEIRISFYQSMFLAGMLLFFYPLLTIVQQKELLQSHVFNIYYLFKLKLFVSGTYGSDKFDVNLPRHLLQKKYLLATLQMGMKSFPLLNYADSKPFFHPVREKKGLALLGSAFTPGSRWKVFWTRQKQRIRMGLYHSIFTWLPFD